MFIFHASRNVVQCLKHLETVQVIEHSAEVNPRKKSGNSYYQSQVTIGRVQNPHIFSMAHKVLPHLSYVTSLCKSAIDQSM